MKSLVPKICVASPAIFSSQHTFLYIKKIFYKNTKAEILRNFKARQFWTGESSGDKVDCKSILRIKTRGWDFENDVNFVCWAESVNTNYNVYDFNLFLSLNG